MLEFRLSGGAGNSDPAVSLGGVISNVEIVQKTAAFVGTPMPGVTILRSSNNPLDKGTNQLLSAVLSTRTWNYKKSLYFVPVGDWNEYTEATDDNNWAAVDVDGIYDLTWTDYAFTASITVSVQTSLLPVDYSTYRITVPASTPGNLFGGITAQQLIVGGDDYRCVYLKNTTAAYLPCRLYFADAPASCVMHAGLDPSASGGVATSIANENVAPAGVTFTRPASRDSAIAFGIGASSHRAVWLRRQFNQLCASELGVDQVPLSVEVG